MIAFRKSLLLVAGVGITHIAVAQFFVRGEVKDEKGRGLQNVKIRMQSTGLTYSSGVEGSFGIPHKQRFDSLTFLLEGYEPLAIAADATVPLQVQLKMQAHTANRQRQQIHSISGNLDKKERKQLAAGEETYNALLENSFLEAARYPSTSLILNVDRASYSNIRRFIHMNSAIPPDGVRIEEMLNYFNFRYTEPPPDSLFHFSTYRTSCPWNNARQLFFIQMNTRKLDMSKVPPANLVFLIDVSGSMDMPNRLPLLQTSFRKLVDHLRPSDTVSIVVYGGETGIMLPPTSGAEKDSIHRAFDGLSAGGQTPGEAGILQAYALAEKQFIKGGNNRVILATDGDFNVGQRNEEQLEGLITRMKQTGIYLTCLGVGMGNYKDSKIEALARKGNGNFAYLDSEAEGEKVLVTELIQTLYTAADDVYMDVTFDPKKINGYRLIGFDNKRGVFSDTTRSIEGGEVGSGHSVLALFEIEPREGFAQEEAIASVLLHYKKPQDSIKRVTSFQCREVPVPFDAASSDYRFAASVALFGMMIRHSTFVKEVTWTDLISIAQKSANPLEPLHREYLSLLQKAQKIYTPLRRKRGHY